MSDLIIKHLENIQDRLSRIENRLDIQTVQPSVPVTPSPIPQHSAPITPAPAEPVIVSAPLATTMDDLDSWANDGVPTTPSTKISYKKEQDPTSSTNWLGYAAIVCFVLAAGFIVKLSIDSGWLTPLRQVCLSALLGGGLIAAGLKLMKFDRAYASLLPAAGIIILYLTSFAAHRYYNLVSFESAILLTTLVSALCVYLYAKIKHDVYAVAACIGTYLSPIILNLHAVTDFTLYYFLVCSLAFSVISIFLKSRLMILISAYLAIFITTLIGVDLHQDTMVASILAFQFLIFTFSTFFYSQRNNTPLTSMEAWSYSPVLLVFYAAEYNFVDQISPNLAPWVAMWFGGILLGLYMAARKLFPQGLASQGLIISFVTLVFFHAGYLELLPEGMHPWLLVALPLIAALVPARFITSVEQKFDGAYMLPMLAVGIIIPIEYFTLVVHLLGNNYAASIWPALATVIAMWVFLVAKLNVIRTRVDAYYFILASTHALAILGLYRFGSDIGSLAVSASWLFYAVGIILFANAKKDEVMAKSALFVLGFAAAKALLYDASSAPTLVRIVCLLLTGVVLYGCGFLLRRIKSWTN